MKIEPMSVLDAYRLHPTHLADRRGSFFEAWRLSDLTAATIQAALARIREEGRAAQTANHFRAAIRAFLTWSNK